MDLNGVICLMCDVLLYHAVLAKLCRALPCQAVPCQAMPCHAVSRHAAPCHAILGLARPGSAMPCHAGMRHAMSHLAWHPTVIQRWKATPRFGEDGVGD